jgi:hypothetical protein
MKAIIYDDFLECLSSTTFYTEGLTAFHFVGHLPRDKEGKSEDGSLAQGLSPPFS